MMRWLRERPLAMDVAAVAFVVFWILVVAFLLAQQITQSANPFTAG